MAFTGIFPGKGKANPETAASRWDAAVCAVSVFSFSFRSSCLGPCRSSPAGPAAGPPGKCLPAARRRWLLPAASCSPSSRRWPPRKIPAATSSSPLAMPRSLFLCCRSMGPPPFSFSQCNTSRKPPQGAKSAAGSPPPPVPVSGSPALTWPGPPSSPPASGSAPRFRRCRRRWSPGRNRSSPPHPTSGRSSTHSRRPGACRSSG